MNEKMKKIAEEMSENPGLMEKVSALNEKYPERDDNLQEFISLLKEYGYDITEADIDSLSDVSEAELDQTAGGRIINGSGDCFCIAGGGGVEDEWQKTCACVVGGGGSFTEAGKEKFHGGAAMACIFAGMGFDSSKK